MIAFRFSSLCKEAEAYYYDFLRVGDANAVPGHVIDHVRACRHCRESINRLDKMLSELDGGPAAPKPPDPQIVTMLRLCFAYIGKEVTCQTVKPFLPTLLEPSLQVRIPTPITVHIDYCKTCFEDLQTIRRLHLGRNQLCRLSQFYADKVRDRYSACDRAQQAIIEVANMNLHQTNAETLRHLCLCPDCRKLLFETRQFVIEELPESERKDSLCGQIAQRDMFDYAVPYGIDPARDQYAKFRQSLTSHMRQCRVCLGRIQQIHQSVFGIAEREDSGVVTVYHTIEPAEAETAVTAPSEDLYAGFPVRVEVTGSDKPATARSPLSTAVLPAQRRRFLPQRLGRWGAFAGAAAAVIILVIFFSLGTPSAKATTLEQLYQAILAARNVYIASFVPGSSEPTQEQWVSRSLRLYLMRTGSKSVLWDMSAGVRISVTGTAGVLEHTDLSVEAVEQMTAMLDGVLGLVPFEDVAALPKNAMWTAVADQSLTEKAPGTKVYDLTWQENQRTDRTVLGKLRVFFDPQARRLRRTEFYQRLQDEQDYTLKAFKLIDYPMDGDIEATVQQLFPPAGLLRTP